MPALHRGDVVVFDNLSSHLSPGGVRGDRAGRGERLPLPPYSPDFNPIETDQADSTSSDRWCEPTGAGYIGVAALLELAAWCRQHLIETPGESPCPPPSDVSLPPAADDRLLPAGDHADRLGSAPERPTTADPRPTRSAPRQDSWRPLAARRSAMSDPLRSPKLRAWHLDRSAFVYVRQSTPQQVIDHQESTARQYALASRAVALGWSPDRMTTIDDDLGKSGQSIEGRPGFQRLLAEVALDHVGLILGLEMSRLARSNRDWHQLLELCARFRVLLADAEAIYDPTDHNDRLLLGLHGMMSEAELHVLKERMYQGKLNKARRGALMGVPPIGYIRLASGEWAIDPDEQVQSTVRLIFDQFDRATTLHGLLRHLVYHRVLIPVRPVRVPAAACWSGGGQTGRRWRICCTTRAMPGPTGLATGRSTRVASSRDGRPPAG